MVEEEDDPLTGTVLVERAVVLSSLEHETEPLLLIPTWKGKNNEESPFVTRVARRLLFVRYPGSATGNREIQGRH